MMTNRPQHFADAQPADTRFTSFNLLKTGVEITVGVGVGGVSTFLTLLKTGVGVGVNNFSTFFKAVGGILVNLAVRKSTELASEYLHSNYELSPAASKGIKVTKIVIDEGFNQIFHSISSTYSLKMYNFLVGLAPSYKHLLFLHKAAAPVAGAYLIYITDIILYKDWEVFLEPGARHDSKIFLVRHSSGQIVKFGMLTLVTDPIPNMYAGGGGAVLYGMRTGEDKYYFNYTKNLAEELTKVILEIVNSTAQYHSTNCTCSPLELDETQANIKRFNKAIRENKDNLIRTIENTKDLEQALKELMQYINSELCDKNLQPFINDIFITAVENLRLIEKNHAISNTYFTFTDIGMGVLNNLAFNNFIYKQASEIFKLLIGGSIRASEALGRFIRDEIFSQYIKTPYKIDSEDIISLTSLTSNATDIFKLPTCLKNEEVLFFNALPLPSIEVPPAQEQENHTCPNVFPDASPALLNSIFSTCALYEEELLPEPALAAIGQEPKNHTCANVSPYALPASPIIMCLIDINPTVVD